MKEYIVHYELPPLRVLLNREVRADSSEDAVEKLKNQIQMPVKIRSVEEKVKGDKTC